MFNNLTVKNRLFCLIGLMAAIMIVLASWNLRALYQTNNGLKSVYLDRTIPVAQLSEIKAKQLDIRLNIAHAINAPDDAERSLEKIKAIREEIDMLWNDYAKAYMADEEKILAEKFLAARKKYITEGIDPILEKISKKETQNAQQIILEKIRPLFVTVSQGIDELVELQKNVAQQEYDTAQSRYQFSFIMSVSMLTVGLGLSLFVGLMIVNRLNNELGGEPSYAAAVVKKIAKGNLSTRVELRAGDKDSLLYAIDQMREMLLEIISNTNMVMTDISNGELSSSITVEVQGDFIPLKESINETVQQLRITLFTLNDVMYSIYNADFSKVIVARVKGKFKETVDKALISQSALHDMLKDVGDVMEKVAVGDLSHRVTAEGRGEMLALKENINNTLTVLDCLNEIERVAQALAQGDLTQSITTHYPGVFGNVTVSMSNTAQHLKSLIGDVHIAAQTIRTAAKEIAAGNNDLSHRTEEQAASLEETAASMQELTGTVQQNNTHAEDANKMANDAANIATRGVDAMNSVVETMEDINTSSHRIVDIITVIDDIAFQTNILALNAAVEAARAGESGKGFAVVAVEVRNLAQRAANAAGEIKRLIDDSVERISGGSKQVEQAGQTMQEIVNSIRNVSAIINEITTASKEQTAGISQVNQAIRQMDDVTQQNAALVEQAAAAAESLEDQTRELSNALHNFKV